MFALHSKDLQGFNDLLALTQPAIIEEIHRKYLEPVPISRDQHFTATSISMSTSHGGEGLRHQSRRSAARRPRRARSDPRRLIVRGSSPARWPDEPHGLLSPDVNNPAFAPSISTFWCAYAEQRGACWTAAWTSFSRDTSTRSI